MARRSSRRSATSKAVSAEQAHVLTIERLGRRGEGIARIDDRRVFIPYALAGERVRATVARERGALIEVIAPASERVSPFCPHFGTCGGCAVQHLEANAYASWKRGIVETALGNRGLDAPVEALIDAHGQGRRRATFHVVPVRGKRIAGFSAARSHEIIDLDACPILVPKLGQAPELARALAEATGSTGRIDVQFTVMDGGIDANVTGARALTLDARRALAAAAEAWDLARLAVAGDIVVERRMPMVGMGIAQVSPPPGAFLQATEEGERTLADLVSRHVPDARRIADLFAGVGPFALRLAQTAAVYAADFDDAALAALERAAHGARELKPVETHARDLQTRPLMAAELAGFDAVVFDPPRFGAEAQAHALAISRVPRIAAVGCDPATFARDTAILVEGGYRLQRVIPVDQFKWSPHVEIVGLLERDR